MSKEKIHKDSIDDYLASWVKTQDLTEYKLKTILNHMNMSIFDYNIKEDTVYIARDAMLLQGFTDYWFQDDGEYYFFEHLTERLPDLVRSSFVESVLEKLEEAKHNTSGELIEVDAPVIYSERNTRWIKFILNTLVDEEGEPAFIIGYCKDIHEEKKELYRLQRVAQTDSLTGFRNKATGMLKIRSRVEEDNLGTYFIAVVDLDKFKEANDLFGHTFGDLILKEAADCMMDFLGHEAICCRTGGDEFMLFRRCDDSDNAMQKLSELRKRIEHKISYQCIEYEVSASIGISIYPIHGTDLDELYNKADMAMYHAKKNKLGVPALYNEKMNAINVGEKKRD